MPPSTKWKSLPWLKRPCLGPDCKNTVKTKEKFVRLCVQCKKKIEDMDQDEYAVHLGKK